MQEKKLFYLTVRFKYVLSYPPDPYDYLLPRQVTALKEVLERVNRHRKNALSVEELQAFLNGATGEKPPHPQASTRLSEDLLREWYHKDLPKRSGLSSIPIPWTWNHYESWCSSNKVAPDLAQFHDLLWHLNRAGKVEFIPHSPDAKHSRERVRNRSERSTRRGLVLLEMAVRWQHGSTKREVSEAQPIRSKIQWERTSFGVQKTMASAMWNPSTRLPFKALLSGIESVTEDGQTRALFLVGPAGSGKSHFVRQIEAKLAPWSIHVCLQSSDHDSPYQTICVAKSR